MAPTSPTVAGCALGLRLREKREAAGLSGSEAARKLRITSAYLSEVETGKKNPSADRLEVLLEGYGFDPVAADELRALRDEATRKGWWNSYATIFGDNLLRYFAHEHGAKMVEYYAPGIVPGLLQTEEYARAIIESGSPNLRLAEVERRVQCRLLRQRRLSDEHPVRVEVIMGEATLRQQVGGSIVQCGQIRHLSNMLETKPEQVSVQVVPFEAPAHQALGGASFHLMSFRPGTLPMMLWQESVTSTYFVSDPQTVLEHKLALTEVAKLALDREASLRLIQKAAS